MHRLSSAQKAMLWKLWKQPSYQALAYGFRQSTSASLSHHGYIELVRVGTRLYYGLAYPGIRYCQTGKIIGE